MTVGWSRDDLEAPQPVNDTPGNMLHPTQLHYGQQLHHSPTTPGSGTQVSQFSDSPPPWQPAKESAAVQANALPNASNPAELPGGATKPAGTIFGLHKTTLFLIISNILLAIALIVVGVVLGRDSNNNSAAALVCSGNGTATASGASSSSSSSSSSVEAGRVCFATDKDTPGVHSMAPGDVTSDCPLGADKGTYTVPGAELKFRRVCGTDIYGDDMGRFPVVSMEDCIALCAWLNLYPASALGGCRGVAWAYGDGAQGKGIAFCYPKAGSVKESDPRNGTEVAILTD